MVAAVHSFDTFIPVSDGTRLAARVWLPVDACERPIPAILEAHPYRLRDQMMLDDATRQPFFARHGYAAVRVDLRGSGDSGGVLCDEYLPLEQQDLVDAIAWIARAAWCDGRVGMIGLSWGGFSALQVAARRPPALRAVITLYSTDDRYADDVHYRGGALLGEDMLSWATTLRAFAALPPDPGATGADWRARWRDRLDATPDFAEIWLRHPLRDDYWRQGSICECFEDVDCPVFAVGGFADGYTNAVLRLLEGLRVPRRGLIGPWAHAWPNAAQPGPAIGFLHECVRWWDRWLREEAGEEGQDPTLRVWLSHLGERGEGRWFDTDWPDGDRSDEAWFPAQAELRERPLPAAEARVASDLAHGRAAGVFCPSGARADAPGDQREDDERAVCFDTPPLERARVLLGRPRLEIALSADRPRAKLVARLCGVAPDGRSTLLSRGVLRLDHSPAHEALRPLVPGEVRTYRIELDALAVEIPTGHRLRLALAPEYWPFVWPEPELAELTVETGTRTRLVLPTRARESPAIGESPFGPPDGETLSGFELLRRGRRTREQSREHGRDVVRVRNDAGRLRLSTGTELESVGADRLELELERPLSARVVCTRTQELAFPAARTRIVARAEMSAASRSFHLAFELEAFEDGRRIHTRTSRADVPRDPVSGVD